MDDLRASLLELHKTLMELERIDYERLHGKVTPHELLRLLLQDKQFAWLHTISELIVRIDELSDAKEPAKEEDIQSVLQEARKLLTPMEISAEFGQKYQDALQREPAVVVAHQHLRDALK